MLLSMIRKVNVLFAHSIKTLLGVFEKGKPIQRNRSSKKIMKKGINDQVSRAQANL